MNAALQEDLPMAKYRITLARGLTFPEDVVTQTVAILARKGSGKSFTLRRLAEQLYGAGQQIVLVDPKGDQWGIRSAADGKGPGLGCIILGGEHGDLPLEVGSGELVAKLVVEERVSVVLDLSLFRKNEIATFMAAFLENLYRLKAREAYRTPLMLFLDEADAIAPQKPYRGEERMLGAIEDIVRRGRQRGIGCTLVTQRSAVLNKNVLTQAQVMIAMRTIAPQDLAAMDAWIDVHGTPEQRSKLLDSLPSLPVGDAWVWSPGWPTDEGIFLRVHVERIETFDSGATPKPGERRVEPKERADVDLEALRRRMAATVERARASDPKLLQKRVRELEAELKKAAGAAPAPAKVETKRVEVPVLKDGQVKRLEDLVTRLDKLNEAMQAAKQDVVAALLRASRAGQAPPIATRAPGSSRAISAPAVASAAGGWRELHPLPTIVRPAPRPRPDGAGDAPVGNSGLRRMLVALAQRPQGLTNRQLGVRAGVSSRSGTFSTYLSRARSQGWIADQGEIRRITEVGVAALGSYDPLPEGAELARHWIQELGSSGAARMLQALVDAYPNALTNDQLGEAAGISSRSGTFATYLSRLRSLELVTGRGELRASEELAG